MRVLSLVVLLQSIWTCAARPLHFPPSAILTTNTDETWTWRAVVGGFDNWRSSPKPIDKDQNAYDDSLCVDDVEKSEQSLISRCEDKP